MTRMKVLGPCLGVSLALTAGLIWLATPPAESRSVFHATDDPPPQNPLLDLDAAARLATGTDEQAVGDLADRVLALANLYGGTAASVSDIKDRLVRAEIAYRSGTGDGVSEFTVARAVNWLADEIDAPAFARTDVFEVRRLQLGVLPHLPAFLGARWDASVASAATAAVVDPELSPLQAAFVALLMVTQKQDNAEYQLTNTEWIGLHGGSRTADSEESFRTTIETSKNDPARSQALDLAVEAFVAKPETDLLALPGGFLDALGVAR